MCVCVCVCVLIICLVQVNRDDDAPLSAAFSSVDPIQAQQGNHRLTNMDAFLTYSALKLRVNALRLLMLIKRPAATYGPWSDASSISIPNATRFKFRPFLFVVSSCQPLGITSG